MARVIGWDIGGAHLKLALVEVDGARVIAARQTACPLWQGLDRLETAFDAILEGLPVADHHAVTMTGEMVDLFPDRPAGVRAILGAVAARFGDGVMVYGIASGLTRLEAAIARPEPIASANWHATAAYVASVARDALLVDIGSTTSDLAPVIDGAVAARGLADLERLARGELVYAGVARTPLMALARRVPFEGRRVGVAAEYYATIADAYRVLERLPEGADQHPTADGRSTSVADSRARLARMIGADAAMAPEAAWRDLARAFAALQLEELVAAARGLKIAPDAPVIGAGVGRFVARDLADRLGRPYQGIETLFGLSGDLGERAAGAAPAVALALLAASSLSRAA